MVKGQSRECAALETGMGMADLLGLVFGTVEANFSMRVALMNLQIKSFAYRCWSWVSAEVCAALETGKIQIR